MLLVWFMAFLSILLSFFVKFSNRRDKNKPLDPIFWIKNNYPELVISVLSMVILLILAGKTSFNIDKITEQYPIIDSLPLDLIVAALIGYLNNTLWYWLVNVGKKRIGMK